MTLQSNDREQTASKYIPYRFPIDEHTVSTVDWDMVRTIQLTGLPFETMAGSMLNGLSDQLFSSLNTLGARNTRVALWTHIVRRKINYDFSSIDYDNPFSRELNKQYGARLSKEDFYVNELYLSPVYRPAASDAERLAQRFITKAEDRRAVHAKAHEEIGHITDQLMVSLRRYHPTLLGTREDANGDMLADYAELYARILNGGDSPPVAVNRYMLRTAILRSELTFEGDVVVIDRPGSTRYAAILSLRAPYSIEQIRPNILHGLYKLNCEFILSQSLTFMSMVRAERLLKIQLSHVQSTTANEDQIRELNQAIGQLQNGKFGMGEHEFTLTIYGDSIAELNDAVHQALSAFEEKNLEVFRETRGTLISSYFGMLPGNFRTKRPRAQPISTANFVSFFPMHNYVTGSAAGSQWGMPIAMLKTNGQSPYFFNYHVSRQSLKDQGAQLEYALEEEEDDDSVSVEEAEDGDKAGQVVAIEHEEVQPRRRQQRKDSGNFIGIGPNGSGKTVAQCLLRALARKTSVKNGPYRSFTFDRDCGQEIFISALGGVYFRFTKNEQTGINLFSLENNARNNFFQLSMAKWCAEQYEEHGRKYAVTPADEKALAASIQEVYKLSQPRRRWARLLDTLKNPTLITALSRWVEDGAYAWVLDCDSDRFDLTAANDFGFDMTDFLDDNLARTPILRYLRFKIKQHAPGRPHSIELDEASVALQDPMLRHEWIEDDARRIRKQEGLIGLGVQDASDLTQGPLSGVLTTQFPTLMIFPNLQADPVHYMQGLKLTKQEFDQVRTGMHDKPGSFLLKRGVESVVVQLDLSGMDDILSVLSGSVDNLPIARNLIEQYNGRPELWLPEFFKRRN